MKNGYWIKLHLSVLDDPILGLLDDHLFSLYIKLLLYAKQVEQNGKLPKVKELAWRLRMGEDELLKNLQELAIKELVKEVESGIYFITDFEESQAPIPAKERMRQYRKRDEIVTYRNNDSYENVTNKNNPSVSVSTSTSTSISDSDSNNNSGIFNALTKAGIRGLKRDNLSKLPHISVDYVEAWDVQLRREKGGEYNPGLLITILESGEPLPENRDDRRKYISGEFADFIEH